MTVADKDASTPDARGTEIAGAQSAGTTTLYRYHLARRSIGERVRTDPTVQSLVRRSTGVKS